MRIAFALLLVATLFLGLLFAWRPEIDLAVAAAFFDPTGFSANRIPALIVLRMIGYWTPSVLMAGAAIAYGLKRMGWIASGPRGRSILFMAISLAVGPGLLMNVGLKNHSHRPRPVQVSEFGGAAAFTPWDRFDGGCKTNCSFASGEVSAAFWTVAPALLTPPPFRAVSIGAAIAFGTAVSALRLAFGGHFLSDVVLSATLTLLLVLICAWLFDVGSRQSLPKSVQNKIASASNLRDQHPSL